MIGKRVGQYKVVKELGGGGMGVLYKAVDTKLRNEVALKFLPPELSRNDDAKKRLEHEAQALAALDHPNICTVHSIQEAPDGRLFFSMTYYHGDTLLAKLERGPLAVRDAIKIAIDVAGGLGKAHGAGIVHRDIKPGNIMVTEDGTVKILDFGIAKLADRTKLTSRGSTLGTMFYMSPEQLTGTDIDGRSDLFSLGVVLYEMLTGHTPFESDHQDAVYYKIINEEPAPLASFRNDLPKGLQAIIDKALQKKPKNRYPSAARMQADLERVLRGRMPHPRIRQALIIGSAALLIAFGAFKLFDYLNPVVPAEKRMIVLPFLTDEADATHQAIVEGLRETVIETLAGLEQYDESMWVVPAARMRKRDFDGAADAGGIFGVNLLVSGRVERMSDNVVVDLALVDAASQRRLREASYQSAGLVSLQDGLVAEVTGLLGVELTAEESQALTAGGTLVPQACEAYLEGLGYLPVEKSLGRAIERFEAAIAADPAYALAHGALARACWQRYRETEEDPWAARALASCNRAIQLAGGVWPLHVALGDIYNGTGGHEQAVAAYKRALELNPASSVARQGLAVAFERLGRRDEAEATYKKATEQRPDFWPAHEDLGYFYYFSGRYPDAIAQFERLVELTPRHNLSLSNLGAFYYLSGDMDQARRLWEASFAIKKSFRACTNLGTLYFRQRRYADAARMFAWAVEFAEAESDYTAWGNLGSAYSQVDSLRHLAPETYRKAIEMAEAWRRQTPDDPIVVVFLAGYYADVGDGEASRSRLERALEMAPKNAEVLFRAGHAYEKLGAREKALVWIGRAIEYGYPADEILEDPELVELRKDPRFSMLLPNDRAQEIRR